MCIRPALAQSWVPCRYNVVGHVKTVIILAGGYLFFQDDMPLKKLAGIAVAMSGIVWYTQVG